jgi:hypothetical protein
MSFDRLLFARLLLSLVTLGYGLVTVKADFNKTHATNPLWTGHARFAAIVYGAFFITLLCMPLYGGRTFDDNGYPPFKAMGLRLDANVTVFSAMVVILVVRVALA